MRIFHFSFGDTLVAENNNLFTYETVNRDENGNLYVIYKGEKYQVIKIFAIILR